CQNFSCTRTVMRQLEEFTRQGRAHLVTTEINKREVEASIGERVRLARAARRRINKDHPIRSAPLTTPRCSIRATRLRLQRPLQKKVGVITVADQRLDGNERDHPPR